MSSLAQQVEAYLAGLPAWQRANLETFRGLVHEADQSITEDFKWSVPVFLINGKMIFAMSAFKAHTKYNFIANGALLEDPDNLFNNGLDSKKNRSIDLHEGEPIQEAALTKLIVSAIRQFTGV